MDDKKDLGRKIVEFARAEMTKGFDNAPPCNQCLATTIMAAFVLNAQDVAEGDHMVEIMGLVQNAERAESLLSDIGIMLMAALVTKLKENPHALSAAIADAAH